MQKRALSFRWLAALAATTLVAACADQGPSPLTLPESGAPLLAAAPEARTVPDRYIVVLKAGADAPGLAERTVRMNGGTVHFVYRHALNGFAATLPAAAVQALRSNPQVEFIEPDQVMYLGGTQSPATWGLDRVDQRNLPLNNTYTDTYTGAGVHVYVIDTGLRADHTEFSGRVGNGWSYIADGLGTGDCGNGHGTHVAGTIAGTTWGVAKSAVVHPVRVFDCAGNPTSSSVVAGVDGVTANAIKPAVANMSLWGGASTALDNAVRNSITSGVTYVVIAGNNNGANACNYSPARVAEAITVGATTSTDARSSFSNIGSCVDIFAPGSSITSAGISSNTATAGMSGTSMAAPHVAGAAAQYLQENPSATPATVQSTLKTRATANVLTSIGTGSPNRLLYVGPYVPPLYAWIDGETYIYVADDYNWDYHTWTAGVSGGTAPYSYQWAVRYPKYSTTYGSVGGNSPSVTFGVVASDGNIDLRLTVTDAAGTSYVTNHYVTVSGPGSGCGPEVIICDAQK